MRSRSTRQTVPRIYAAEGGQRKVKIGNQNPPSGRRWRERGWGGQSAQVIRTEKPGGWEDGKLQPREPAHSSCSSCVSSLTQDRTLRAVRARHAARLGTAGPEGSHSHQPVPGPWMGHRFASQGKELPRARAAINGHQPSDPPAPPTVGCNGSSSPTPPAAFPSTQDLTAPFYCH